MRRNFQVETNGLSGCDSRYIITFQEPLFFGWFGPFVRRSLKANLMSRQTLIYHSLSEAERAMWYQIAMEQEEADLKSARHWKRDFKPVLSPKDQKTNTSA